MGKKGGSGALYIHASETMSQSMKAMLNLCMNVCHEDYTQYGDVKYISCLLSMCRTISERKECLAKVKRGKRIM